MAERTDERQSEHDKVVEASATTWRKNQSNVVYTNPSGKQNFAVNRYSYPDVVVTDRNNRLVVIEEI